MKFLYLHNLCSEKRMEQTTDSTKENMVEVKLDLTNGLTIEIGEI